MSKRSSNELMIDEVEVRATRDPLFVGSVEKALRVLQVFSQRRMPLSLSEIAQGAGLPKSAAQRFCHTLTTLGYLTKDPHTRRMRPSAKVLDCAYAFLRSEPLIDRATPFVIETSERCGERVNMSLRDGDDLVYAIRVARRVVDVESTMIGRRWPLANVAGGRAILSTLPPEEVEAIVRRTPLVKMTQRSLDDADVILERVEQARERGYALNEEEALRGEIAVAAPVRDHDGRGIAAVHIAVSSVGWTVERVAERLAPLAVQTANAISREQMRF